MKVLKEEEEKLEEFVEAATILEEKAEKYEELSRVNMEETSETRTLKNMTFTMNGEQFT